MVTTRVTIRLLQSLGFRVWALCGRVQRLGKQVIKVEGLRFMDMATVIADLIVSWLISVASGLLGFRV